MINNFFAASTMIHLCLRFYALPEIFIEANDQYTELKKFHAEVGTAGPANTLYFCVSFHNKIE